MIKKIKELIFGENWLIKDIPIIKVLLIGPATPIASILGIIFSIISLPFTIFGKKATNFVMRTMLTAQHAISLSWPYWVEEYLFDTFEIADILVGSLFALIAFYYSIQELVNETMVEYNFLDPKKIKKPEESKVVVEDDAINDKEIKINGIYGITTAYDFSKNREESFKINDKIYYYYEQKNQKHMLLKTVKDFEEGKEFIDEIISLNGGVDNFKKVKDYNVGEESLGSIEIKYIHEGDLFWIELQFINSIGKIEVAISKVDEFTAIDRDQNIDGGISRHDKKIRNLIKGLDKIIYNESEGPSNGRLCLRGEAKDESFFIYAYFDTLNDSFSLFKKIIKNYDVDLIQELNSYEKNKTLDGIVRSTGIEYKSDEFELLLIRENVKYKFYLTPPGGFFNGKWK